MKKISSLILILFFLFACKKSVKDTDTPPPPPPLPPAPTITQFALESNYVDSVVTITGTHFSANGDSDVVKFNGTVAIVKSATTTQIIVTVPPGATSGKISVRVGTQTATSANDFTVLVRSNEWVLRAPMPNGLLKDAAAFAIGDKLYVGSGNKYPLGGSTAEFWEYDTKTDSWTQKADYAGPANTNIGFSIGSKGYFLETSGSGSFSEYDPATDKWTQKKTLPNSGRANPIAFASATKGYYGLGTTGVVKKDLWEYDPSTDTWTQKSDYPGLTTSDAASFVIGNYVYVGTGSSKSASATNLKEFYQYDFANDSWTQKANFGGIPRYSAVGFSIDSKGYMGTGRATPGQWLQDIWEYDPLSDTWTQKADFTGGAAFDILGFSSTNGGYLGFGIGTNYMVAPGISSGVYFDLWRYFPQ